MLQLAQSGDLPAMFLGIFTLDMAKFIAKRTKEYAYTDWIVPSVRLDRDGNTTRRPIMKAIFPQRGESLPLNAHHRCAVSGTRRQFTITEHFVLAWLGSIIYAGALFHGDSNQGIDAIYTDSSYGIGVPFIRNIMTQDAFIFMRNYIHFSRT